MNPGYYAPTWSWAGVDAPVSYPYAHQIGGQYLVEWDSGCNIFHSDFDVVTLAGSLYPLQLQATIPSREAGIYDPAETALQFTYEVSVLSYDDEELGSMKPDVPLRLDGAAESSDNNRPNVVRVPHGEAPPKETWRGHCLFLVLGTFTDVLKAYGLILGPSMRVPGAFGRLGTFSWEYSEGFQLSPRRRIRIA